MKSNLIEGTEFYKVEHFCDLRNRMKSRHTEKVHRADYLLPYLLAELQEQTQNLEDAALQQNSHYF